MVRQSLAAIGLGGLALAGVASGSGIIIRLPGGTCATVSHTKVCAIKQTPKTVTRTVRLTTTIPTTVTTTATVTTGGPPLASPPPVTTATTTVPTTTTIITTTSTTTTTTTVITTTPKPVAKLCVAPTEVDFGDASNLGEGGSIANIIQVSNCGDLPITLEPPIIGDHSAPFQAVVEDLGGNGTLCPIGSGTELLNPGAVCYVPVIFPRPAPAGAPWPHGSSYQDSWYWRGWTLPGVYFITPYVHMTGSL